MEVVNYLLISFSGQEHWLHMFCKIIEFQAVLFKMLITLFKAEVRDTTSNLIYFLVVMALWGNVMSLCAGSTRTLKISLSAFRETCWHPAWHSREFIKVTQGQDSPELPSAQGKPHWMRCTAPGGSEVTTKLCSHNFTFPAAEATQSPDLVCPLLAEGTPLDFPPHNFFYFHQNAASSVF